MNTATAALLTAAHRHTLEVGSGIAPDLIAERGYRSLDAPADVQALGFSQAQARLAPALAIPLWNVLGQQTLWQIRPEAPRALRGKPVKYETPKGSRLLLDVHPRMQPLLQDPQIPLWITEGTKKGDALATHGACAVALLGVWGFRGTNAHGGKVIVPDWNEIALNGRLVYVAYDSDVMLKPEVQQALDALVSLLRYRGAFPACVQWPDAYQHTKWGVDDFLADGHTLADLQAMMPPTIPPSSAPHASRNGTGPTAPTWQDDLHRTKTGIAQQTINNFVLAIQNLEPWKSAGCWYDLVRERHMVGVTPVHDGDDVAAGVTIEQATDIRVTNIALVGKALDYVCRQTTRDLLQEWVAQLPVMPVSELLTTWLRTIAHVPDDIPDAYVADVSRLLAVGIIARILDPGCQYRYVPIFEGPENAGKSKLTKALAGADAYGQSWHVALSTGLENKEAHMMLQGALIAELEELSSYSKTEENRMRALITAETDSFVPKFSNKRADHPRRTVFIGTVNPEGSGEYLKGQTGNTRYLPLTVGKVDIPKFLDLREQLFAEAKAYYLAHPTDWWQLDCETDVHNEREQRRQTSVYEGEPLRLWLARRKECTWQDVAEQHLQIPRDRWNKALQMELAKALRASRWHPAREDTKRYWVPD